MQLDNFEEFVSRKLLFRMGCKMTKTNRNEVNDAATDPAMDPTTDKGAASKAKTKNTTSAKPKTAKPKTAKPKAGVKKAGVKEAASTILVPEGYRPSDDEEFMNPMQLAYFRRKLQDWRAELLEEASETITDLSHENLHQPDAMDRAQIESNATIDLRTRDRERKLIQKIESALRRIDDGSYGYCVETDEPINLRRLEARPIASLSLHAQERHERMERIHRDD